MRGRERHRPTPKRVAVIGLGRFGSRVARVCHDLGYDVTAIDISEPRVAEAADHATLAAQADGADEKALRSLGVERSAVGVVGQGQNIEASISCALVLKRLGIPWVIAKAETDIHGEILHRIGVDRIVFPERESGSQVAHSLEIRHPVAYMSLTDTSGVARMDVPPHWIGKTVADVEAAFPDVSVLLHQCRHVISPFPGADTQFQPGDLVLVAGLDEALDAFADS